MARTDFRIEGAREMERLLKELGPVAAQRLGDQALRAAGKTIVEEARRLVPVDTGRLRASIVVRTERRAKSEDQRRVLIGFLKPASRLAHLVEFGTVRMAPRPFLRPALDGKAGEALDTMGKTLARGITREARKLAKTTTR